MALVAIHTVVDISLDALVVPVGLALRMAIRALEDGVIIRICMARGTYTICVTVVDRKGRVLTVIEGCIQPVRGAMAILASSREELRLRCVPRIGGVVVIGQVAVNAQVAVQVVVIVDVAVGAGPRRDRVRPRQREARLRVIELAIGPLNGVVTKFASGRETGVRRIVCVLKILLMAGNAQVAVQVVVVVDMAVGTLSRRNGVRTGQRKSGLRMIELAIGPLDRVMTLLAGGRETGVGYRALGVLVVGLVAGVARRVGDVVVVVHMAVGADARRNHV